MDHGRISDDIARGLKELRARILASKIPSASLDETVNIATWNIREFGRKRRSKAAIHYIAEVLDQFDVISVVEVRDNLSDLERVLSILGPPWKVVFSDFNRDAGGNRERIAYIYDSRAVTFTGLAAEANPPQRKVDGEYVSILSWWRSPFMASFRAGHFAFILLSAHIRWGANAGARVAPLKQLAKWVSDRRRERYVKDKDIIVLGDFNIPSRSNATFKAITSYGLEVAPGLLKPDFGTNLAQNKRYDQILHYPMHPSLYRTAQGRYRAPAGVLDFYAGDHRPLFPELNKTKFTYQMSDHLPLWMQLNVGNRDLLLDEQLNG